MGRVLREALESALRGWRRLGLVPAVRRGFENAPEWLLWVLAGCVAVVLLAGLLAWLAARRQSTKLEEPEEPQSGEGWLWACLVFGGIWGFIAGLTGC